MIYIYDAVITVKAPPWVEGLRLGYMMIVCACCVCERGDV